ncbi:MAG: hypothetical protein LBK73_15980 [Treponema sp.]|jgi:hypothetical protein|nr:hypothetical protein [Treponema sp.]
MWLEILFEDSNDDYLEFTGYFNYSEGKFELIDDKVMYGGLEYQIEYGGEELPYLKYKLLERQTETETQRKAKGRRVGS